MLYQSRSCDIELHMTSEGIIIKDDLAVPPDIEPQIHALIDGKPHHQLMLVINMGV